MKIKFSRQILEKYSTLKFYENSPTGAELYYADRYTDRGIKPDRHDEADIRFSPFCEGA
jgi:hypothetical protein